jgi:hypothetical protein
MIIPLPAARFSFGEIPIGYKINWHLERTGGS